MKDIHLRLISLFYIAWTLEAIIIQFLHELLILQNIVLSWTLRQLSIEMFKMLAYVNSSIVYLFSNTISFFLSQRARCCDRKLDCKFVFRRQAEVLVLYLSLGFKSNQITYCLNTERHCMTASTLNMFAQAYTLP